MLILGVVLIHLRHTASAFSMTGLGAIGYVATIFTGLYPRVLVANPEFANSLTISNSAAGHYALQVITIIAMIFVPIVLLYQGWTYYVFRRRLTGEPVRLPIGGAARRSPESRAR